MVDIKFWNFSKRLGVTEQPLEVLMLGLQPTDSESEVETAVGNFPGGPVVKNLPCNAGDESLIPGWGTKIPQAWEQLRPCTTNCTGHML